jgi:translation initiation factor 4E
MHWRRTLYFDSKSFNPSAAATTPQSGGAHTPDAAHAQSWEAALKLLGVYTTVESFMSIFATLRRPSQLERNSNYHLFKSGIKPMWEDPANANGGKWVLTLRNTSGALLDRSWMWLVLALIGEELDDGDTITGAVVSTRAKGDRIALWLRTKDDVELINRLGKKLVHLLDVEREPGVSLEFSFNSGGAPLSATPSGTVTSPQTLRFVHFHNAPAQQMPSFSAQGPLGGYAPRGNMGPPPLPGSSPTKQQLHAPPPQHGPGSSPQRGNYAGSANMIPMPRRGSEQGSLGAPPQHHAGGSPSFGSSPGSGGAAGAFSSLQRHGSQQGGLGVSGGHLGRNGPSPPAPMQSPQGAGAFGTSPVRGSYMPPQARQQQQQGGPMPPPSFGARGPPQPFRSAGSNAGSPPL